MKRGINDPADTPGGNALTFYGDLNKVERRPSLQALWLMLCCWGRDAGAEQRYRDYFKPRRTRVA